MAELNSHDDARVQSRRMISPPPLKRQRTGDCSSVVGSKPSRNPALYDLPVRHAHSTFRRNFSLTSQPFHGNRSELFREMMDLRRPSLSQRASFSSDSQEPHSDARSTSSHGLSNRGGCHKCGVRFRATSYGLAPVLCQGCKRKYHDYCCRPPIAPKSDLQLWRCETCVDRKRKRSLGLSTSTQGSEVGKYLQNIPTSTSWNNTFAATTAGEHAAIETTDRVREKFGHCGTSTGTQREGPGNGRPGLRWGSNASTRPDLDIASMFPMTIKASISLVRTEIPGTPSQHSSQQVSSGALPDMREVPRDRPSQECIDPPLQQPLRLVKTKMPTVPCSLCRQTWMPRRRGVPKPVCQDCADGMKADPPRSTIPESPELDSLLEHRHSSYEYITNIAQDTAVSVEHSVVSGIQSASPRAQLGRVALPYDISRERPLPTAAVATIGHVDTPASTTDIVFVAGGEIIARKGAGQSQRHSHDRDEILCTVEDDENHPVIDVVETGGVEQSANPLPPTVILNPHRPLLPQKALRLHGDEQQIELAEDRSRTTTEMSTIGMTSPDPTINTSRSLSPTTEMRTQRRHCKAKAYTMRELGQIALVAANGRRLTTAEIDTWLSTTFSHLRAGNTGWKARVRSALSGFDEFRGNKIAGTLERGNKKSYGFSSTQVRMHYEREFPRFCLSSASSTTPLSTSMSFQDDSSISSDVSVEGNAHVGLSTSPMDMTEYGSNTLGSITLPQFKVENVSPTSSKQHIKDRYPTMPFERDNVREPRSLLQILLASKRVARYCDVALQSRVSRVDTMTELEKKTKVDQIKARSSRKQNFGADYRLAHKRRYKSQDIHDECDGAWKFSSIVKERMLHNGSTNDDDMEIDGPQTLKELLDLPIYAIPMNDGQSELAFRDGTMVNGKLPRPRNIYKVGKLFGGELTVRAS